jgi:hypothetical protein
MSVNYRKHVLRSSLMSQPDRAVWYTMERIRGRGLRSHQSESAHRIQAHFGLDTMRGLLREFGL